MAKILMRLSANRGILLFSLVVSFGCSSFQDVAIVSQSDEVSTVEEPISEKVNGPAPSPPRDDSAVPPLEPDKKAPPSPATLAPKVSPMTSPVVPPVSENEIQEESIGQSAEDTTLPWTLQDVFFDFDQWTIRKDAIPILEQNAKVLLKRLANRNALIQGHCDEHGTEAYNFILGERRAMAVKNYLVNLGVGDSRLRTLSLGKSQPFCLERTIPCFRQNRRAHFILK